MKNVKMPPKHGALNGTATRAYDAIADVMDLYKAIMEISHNAFEHGNAGNVSIWFDTKNGKPFIRIKNNGAPMSNDVFKKFISEYHCHDVSNSTPLNGVYVSMKGYGLKDAIIYLSSPNGESVVTVTNYFDDLTKTSWTWKVNRVNGDNGSYDEQITVGEYETDSATPGMEITISNAAQFTEPEIKDAKERVKRSFSSELIAKGKSISINGGGKNSLIDPLHFDEFPFEDGENIYNCKPGVYTNNEIIWDVREIKLSGVDENGKSHKKIGLRTVVAYLNGKPYNAIHNGDPSSAKTAGFYPMLGPVYLEQGGNWELHTAGSDNKGGGSTRGRMGILITEENKFLWGIKAFKTNGLKPFATNNRLVSTFKVVDKDEEINGLTVFEYFKKRYAFIKYFHDHIKTYRNGISGHEKDAVKDYVNCSDSYFKGIKLIGTESKTDSTIFVYDERQAYAITSKESPIQKILTEDGWQYETTNDNIGDRFNSASKEELLYIFSEVAEEVGISPDHYQKLFNLLGKKLQ